MNTLLNLTNASIAMAGIFRSSASVWLTFCLLTFLGRSVLADTAEHVIKEAIKNRGTEVIQVAEIGFKATISDAPLSQQRIDDIISQKKLALEEVLRNNQGNPALVKSLQGALANLVEEVTPQLIANSKREVSGTYLIGGPWIGGDRLVDFRLRRGHESESGQQIQLLLRRLSQQQSSSVVFDSEAKTVTVGTRGVTIGIEEPHLLGRMQGLLLRAGEMERSSRGSSPLWLYEYEGDPENDGDDATINAFINKDGRKIRMVRVIISKKLGYVCPLIEEFAESGELQRSWRSSDFFQDLTSGLWFPASCHFRHAVSSQPPAFGEIDYQIDKSTTRFNHKYREDVFLPC